MVAGWAERTRGRDPARRTYLLMTVLQPYPEAAARRAGLSPSARRALYARSTLRLLRADPGSVPAPSAFADALGGGHGLVGLAAGSGGELAVEVSVVAALRRGHLSSPAWSAHPALLGTWSQPSGSATGIRPAKPRCACTSMPSAAVLPSLP